MLFPREYAACKYFWSGSREGETIDSRARDARNGLHQQEVGGGGLGTKA